MKRLRQFLSMLLVCCMLAAMLPITARAAEDTVGSWGTNGTWKFEASTGTLTLWGNEAIPDYDYSWNAGGTPWFSLKDDISSVVISEGITRVGDGAFGGEMEFACYKNLTSVTLPSTLKSIGIYAFCGSSLTSVTLPEHLTTIEAGAFSGTSLTSIHIPAAVSSLGYHRDYDTTWDMFESVKEITVDPANQFFEAEDNVLYDKGKTKILSYPYSNDMEHYRIPSTIQETLYVSDFCGRDALLSITIPANVTLTAYESFNPPDGLMIDYSQSIILYFEGEIPEGTEDWVFYRGEYIISVDAREAPEGEDSPFISLSTATSIIEGTETTVYWETVPNAIRYYVNIINLTTGIYHQKDLITYDTNLPLSPLSAGEYEIYVQAEYSDGSRSAKSNTIYLTVYVEDEQLAFVKRILTYSSKSNLSDTSKESVENAIYNLLFKAHYRPTGLTSNAKQALITDGIPEVQFTGSLSVNETWPLQNKDSMGDSVYDPVLGTIVLKVKGSGCAAYAYFCFSYIYGTAGTYRKWTERDLTASEMKTVVETYVDPGERIGYSYKNSSGKISYHSIVFLGEDNEKKGFYYINYNGGEKKSGEEYHQLDIRYTTYETLAAKALTFTMHDATDRLEKKQITNIVVRIACPVEAIITLESESLDSRNVGASSFGSVARIGEEIIFDLTYNSDYQLIIDGTGEGFMTVTLEYYVADTLVDTRKYVNMPITDSSVITASGIDQSGAVVLFTNSNTGWVANTNETVYAPEDEFSQTEDGPHPEESNVPAIPSIGTDPGDTGGSITPPVQFDWVNPFTDVKTGEWFYDSVRTVCQAGLMNGTGDGTTFSPELNLTRGMMMTILARMDGVDTTGSSPWYKKGMDWAVEKKVSDGTNPTASITREQIAVMLYRFAGSPAVSGDWLKSFPDSDSVSSWAADGMNWAVSKGIINGADGRLNPQGEATRMEAAAMIARYLPLK